MEFKIPWKAGTTSEQLDATPAPVGWWNAHLGEVTDDPEKARVILVFVIDGPENQGCQHKEYLNNPAFGTTQKEVDMWGKKLSRFANRMNMGPGSPAEKSGKIDFRTQIGQKFVLHLVPGSDPQPGAKYTDPGVWVDWAPYPLDHKRIPAAVRVYLGLPLLANQKQPSPADVEAVNKPTEKKAKSNGSAPTQSAAPQQDLSELV